jgi:mannose-6-phosphate isomerase-like protein (cupin superfamily)
MKKYVYNGYIRGGMIMLRRAEEMRLETMVELRGGKGNVEATHILEGDELNGKGRMFARMTLKPGTSIGFHKHEGSFDVYYILQGVGVYNDNGVAIPVKAGDMGIVEDGGSHGLENTSSADLEIISIVLFT